MTATSPGGSETPRGRWSVLGRLRVLAAGVWLAGGTAGFAWALPQPLRQLRDSHGASAGGRVVDRAILAFCLALFLPVGALTVGHAFRSWRLLSADRRPGDKLEPLWAVLPVALLAVVYGLALTTFLGAR